MDAETEATDTFYRLLTWLHANRKQVLIALVVVAVAAIAAGLYSWKKGQDEVNADAALLQLPAGPGANAQMAPVSASSYLDLAKEYPGTSAGEDAQLLGAETLFLEGSYSQAEQEFNQFLVDHPDSDLLPQATLGVAASLEAQSKNSDAIGKYKGVIQEYPTDVEIVSPAKLTLARLNEAENKPDQALAYYAELARNANSYDPWAAEARERAVLLLARHPELRQAQAPANSSSPFSLSQPGSFAPGPPLRQPSASPAPAPAPAQNSPNSGINFLNSAPQH
jgi:predicted negative regulator of RcsB-dependent stress response